MNETRLKSIRRDCASVCGRRGQPVGTVHRGSLALRYATWIRLAGITVIALTMVTGSKAAETLRESLLLEVHINDNSTGIIGAFARRGNMLLSQRAQLTELGIRVPDAPGVEPKTMIALSDLPGLAWRLDRTGETLYVSTGAALEPRTSGGDAPPSAGGVGPRAIPATAIQDTTTVAYTGQTAAGGPAAEAPIEESLLLEVQINGYSTGDVGAFTQRGDELLSQRKELIELGFRIPATVSSGPEDLIALSSVPGLAWKLDRATQTLYVTAAAAILEPTLLRVDTTSSAGVIARSGTGATLNYDISTITVGGKTIASGLLDARVFSPWGVAASGFLARTGGGPGTPATIRLASSYTYSDPDTNRRYRAGDFIAGSLGWTHAVRLAGLQITSDFSMRPDLVTFPVPMLSGSAAVPSTLEVLVNGTQLMSRQVAPGPFEIPRLPVMTGAGTISMTLTNALGRQVVASLPFYAAANLLAPGLHTASLQVGAVRRHFGRVSNDYGKPAATATYRRGLSSKITVEGVVEGTDGAGMAGAGAIMNVADVAVINAAAAASTGEAGTGRQFTLGIRRLGEVFSFGAEATTADSKFRDVAAMNGSPPAQLRLNVNTSLSLGRFGSASIAYARLDSTADVTPITLYVPPGGSVDDGPILPEGGTVIFQPSRRARILSSNYSVQIGRASVYATGYRTISGARSTGIQVGLSLPLSARSSAGGSWADGSGGSTKQIQAAQSASVVGDFGYQAYASTGASKHEFGEADYKASWGLLTAGIDRSGGKMAVRAGASGALSMIDGGLLASNTIYDSFAVVDTNGLANVRVLSENRDAGATNSSGRLLVPDLRSFSINHIAIAPLDIPPDVSIDTDARQVLPQDRSGVVVKFAVRISHGALLRLVDESGAPLPLGATAILLRPASVSVPVGYDGEAYVEDLEPHNELAVNLPNGRRCLATFDYRAIPGDLPVIGPLTCQEQKP